MQSDHSKLEKWKKSEELNNEVLKASNKSMERPKSVDPGMYIHVYMSIIFIVHYIFHLKLTNWLMFLFLFTVHRHPSFPQL